MKYGAHDARGVSEALGYITLVSVIVIGVGIIIYLGGGTLDLVRDDATAGQTEDAFVNFDSAMLGVAHSHPETQIEHTMGVSPQVGGATHVADDGSQLTVRINGSEVLQTDLRTITYQDRNHEYAYQSGAVFELRPEQDVVAHPPIELVGTDTANGPTPETEAECERRAGWEWDDDNNECNPEDARWTLSLTAIELSADSQLDQTSYISHDTSAPQYDPNTPETRNQIKSLNGETVEIEVDSEYPTQWKAALEHAFREQGLSADDDPTRDGVNVSCDSNDVCTATIDTDQANIDMMHLLHATLQLR